MKQQLLYIALCLSFICFGQESAFDIMIHNTLQKTIPFISVDKLEKNYNNYTILDAREINEFQISHLKNAVHVGYNNFDSDTISKRISKDKPVVVYCSIGYRSEKIAEQLKLKGYIVYNLYGGIFQWKNKHNIVIDTSNIETNKVHCYNKKWSKWLINGEKIYE